MARLAIMQGRLVPPEDGRFQSFPRKNWRGEFERAAGAGFECIEWIYDAYGEDVNPCASDTGIAEIRRLAAEHSVAVASVCADYFMDEPIVRANPRTLQSVVSRLYWLIERARRMGASRVVLPFVDASRMNDKRDEVVVLDVLREIVPLAQRVDLEIHLETDFPPERFAAFLDRLPSRTVKVNYDAGNSASLGFDPVEEFAAYGPRIGSVHIKDRLLHGGTVPLGCGDANLSAVFSGLHKLGYSGDYVLQVARGTEGREVEWGRGNGEFVRACIETARNGASAS